ncbi:MAG: glucokinase [Aquabacterium sp.]|uniref:glucokinase n=1 Tax=Aquabacterium sp. TaxID=1872578 RepID=UPI0025BE5A98|nr:glucokinase [Aquabacterium sp.]MBI3382592.1 glucokinase [Aquabacterium sp.]
MQTDYPKLLGDIGGTNVRLALKLSPDGEISHILNLNLRDHADAVSAVEHYLTQVGAGSGPMRPRTGSIGAAGPVLGDHLQLFNAPWGFSIEGLRQALGLTRLRVLNDFTVLALALPHLPQAELRQIGGLAPVAGMTMGLLGAGTGLGVSGLVPDLQGQMSPIAGEGGHVTLAASDDNEERLIALLRRRFGHVSAERVLSGSGLVVLYEAHAQLAGQPAEALMPADVTQRGLAGQCALCEAALNSFCLFMGTVASNLAVSLGAQGGLFIGGGIVPRLGEFFERSGFRERFDAKGRYADYLRRIPVFVIHSPYPALIGAAQA